MFSMSHILSKLRIFEVLLFLRFNGKTTVKGAVAGILGVSQ